jgi:hypothetical protein
MTNNANAKTVRVKMDGNVFSTQELTSALIIVGYSIIRNTLTHSLFKKSAQELVAGIGASFGSIASITIDTTAATTS